MTLILCEIGTTPDPELESWSPFTVKVHRALALAGLAYESERRMSPGDFADLNPAGQIPVLIVDGSPVSDSTDILQRVAGLAPGAYESADPDARLWEEMADADLNSFLVGARWNDDATWPLVRPAFFGPAPDELVLPMREHVAASVRGRNRTRHGIDAFRRRFEARLAQLDARAPAVGFWCGPTISVADLAIFAQLHSLRADITPWYRDLVATRGRLVAYLDRVNALTRPRRAAA